MKTFKEFMSEDRGPGRDAKSLGGDGGSQNQYGRWGQEPVHMGVHRIEDPNVLQRLNAHVGLINTREYIDPLSALEHVQNALMRLGYHFDYNMNEIPNEQNVYPLRRFGGRQGFIDMDAEIKEDDGIEGSGESLVLRVEFAIDPDTSRYEVMAQIVPASLFDEEEVQPEPIRPNRAGVPSTTGDSTGINMGEEAISEAQKFTVSFPSISNRNAALKDAKRLPSGLRTTASAFFPGAGPENGAIFTVSDDGIQTRDLMKLIKKNKGTVTEETIREDLSRTFAFSTSDARDRLEKLLNLTSQAAVSTSNKGKGKFKFTVTGILKASQIDRIMNSVKQLKGKLGENTLADTEEIISEDLSRTFAFSTADARNRLEQLLNLASQAAVSTSNKGKGKFKFTVTGILKASQIDRIMNSVKQLKGKLAENTSADIANDAVRSAIRERAERLHESDPARVNQLKVARQTLKMNPVFQKVMGGPSKEAAIKILMDKGTSADKKLAKKAMNEASAFVEAGLQHARSAVKGGKQFVSVSGKMSEKKASQTMRGAAKFLKQHGTPADKKLAAKVLGEGVQIFPASTRFSGPLRPKPGKFGEAFDVEIGFSADDWKRLAPLVRKAATKAKWKTFDIRSDKVIRVVLKDKDAKKAQKRVSDLVDGVKKSIGVKENLDTLSHDDNAKENRRTKKDNKIASGFNEAVANLTVVAIKGNKVVGQLRFVGKKEVKDVIAFMKKEHPGAKVSVESKSGKIISVEAYTGSFKEQLSKRKKKAPASPSY